MNALSESITALPSCVTDIISLILLHCFGISCVNEHSGTEKKKGLHKPSRDCGFLWALVSLVERKRTHTVVTPGYAMPRIQHEASGTPT